jgi:hypothetical protein
MIDPQDIPDEDREIHLNVAEKVAGYLFHDKELSAKLYDFNNTDIGQELLNVLNNPTHLTIEQKLAEMRDVRDDNIDRLANWVEQNYLTDPVAGELWREAVDNV